MATVNGTLAIRQQHAQLKAAEAKRNGLVESLLDEVDDIKKQLQTMESERDREKEAATMFHQRLKDFKDGMIALQRTMERNAFVLVLIDGDCMNVSRLVVVWSSKNLLTTSKFLDDLVGKLEAGGEETAERLRTCIRKYLEKAIPDAQGDLEPIVRVYANMRGLAKTLVDAKILESVEDLGRFVCGFNKKFTSFDFIDAGNGKECSDAKLKRCFELSIHNVHCKHIIFGGSADNGYARLLNSYTGDPSTSKKITMLEGPPFAAELIPIVEKLKKCSFPAVLRDTKIAQRRVSFSTTPPRSKSPAVTSYASTAATAKVDNTPVPITSPGIEYYSEPVIPRNSKGQRIDPIVKPPQAAVLFVKSHKLCKNHHLLEYCVYADNECQYQHQPPLDKQRLDALRAYARQMPCGNGLKCDEPDCYYGHRCRGDPCRFEKCVFPPEMHYVDTKVVN
ncbi:MAG: hypothetical protein Q9168_005001 [Polycauliona sp. 1 TL-2023]